MLYGQGKCPCSPLSRVNNDILIHTHARTHTDARAHACKLTQTRHLSTHVHTFTNTKLRRFIFFSIIIVLKGHNTFTLHLDHAQVHGQYCKLERVRTVYNLLLPDFTQNFSSLPILDAVLTSCLLTIILVWRVSVKKYVFLHQV